MKIVASHQPHFFPWLGYFDKMAKADIFLINDLAQLEKKSPMIRNKILDENGLERIINVIIDKTGYMEKQNRDIDLIDWKETRKSLLGKIKGCYNHAPYFAEIWPYMIEVLDRSYSKLIDLDVGTIEIGRRLLGIDTPIIFQSTLTFKEGSTTSEKLAEKLYAVNTDIYLSGNGGKKYMDINDFSARAIEVVFQSFSYPVYPQLYGGSFIPNLSFLDIVFNCGIERGRNLFWDNVRESHEIPK